MSGPNLDNLTSKKLYKQWSQGVNSLSYLSTCFDFPSTPPKISKNIIDLCGKLLRNLNDMPYRENDECYTCGHRELLNYWLYDQVKQILGSEYINNYTQIIKDLHAVWSKYKIHKLQQSWVPKIVVVDPQCKPETPITTIQDIEDKKNIQEHCLNYYEISKNNISNVECQEYKDYVESQSLKYGKFENLFPKDKTKCPNYYKKCKSYNPINISTDSNCPHDIEISETSEEVSAPPGQSSLGEGERVDEVEVGEEAVVGKERLSGRKGEQDVDVDGDREDGKIKGGGLETPLPIGPLQGDYARQDLSIGNPEGYTDVNNVQSLNDSPDNVKSSGTIISASSVGTIGFLFLLYKFTPLRSMIDPRIRNTKNNLINGVQGGNELQSQNIGFYPTDMDFNRYNIGYQSRKNN
ncbi:Plasmodium vivax Vir protein, putative [Plasmodium vivax]|uniref:Vir protein, putative n=1 Tax=Plasmodium vivax TaxID=5855 RepID=A0A1G4EBZ4_PLAVI|nr:Plasmodium vivax Vir protein, putative [Plasmodium vivax]